MLKDIADQIEVNKQLYDKNDNEEFEVEDSADFIEQVKDANGKTIGVMSFIEE